MAAEQNARQTRLLYRLFHSTRRKNTCRQSIKTANWMTKLHFYTVIQIYVIILECTQISHNDNTKIKLNGAIIVDWKKQKQACHLEEKHL